MTKVEAILSQIDSGSVLLPEFQRGYVWNRDQVRGLMRSLYRGYPVGGLLVWETEAAADAVRGDLQGGGGVKQLLLDGQQRITSLYGVSRGRPPAFFEGNPAAFTGLHFNVEDETFEFYAPAKMQGDPRWVDVTALYVRGLEPQIARLNASDTTRSQIVPYMTRLTRLHAVLDKEFYSEKITGPDKSIEDVVEIFNRVNSGGTKLSKGDLALARICAQWPEARSELRRHLHVWRLAGYEFDLDWLMRNVNAIATGKAPFSALDAVAPSQFRQAITEAAEHVGAFLDLAASRLGLDHNRVLMGRYAIPVVSRFQHLNGGTLGDARTQSRLLFWYVHTALWGRFTGSTETVLAQDYETLNRSGVDGLIGALEQWRGGNLTVGPHDFAAFGRGSRFYPLLYMLTRVGEARDFGNGLPLKSQMLGPLASLQVHHIFPKAQLYKAGYSRAEVNAVPNFCFLTQNSNLAIGQRRPEDYFPEVASTHPGALASQWVPLDQRLWRIDRYRDFLAARRELLANAANDFLGGLRSARFPRPEAPLPRVELVAEEGDDLAPPDVRRLVEEMVELGFAKPELDVEISDPESGAILAVAEAFWREGLQTGIGKPVVLELDPEEADLPRLQELGYDIFSSADALRGFVRRQANGASGDDALAPEPPAPVPASAEPHRPAPRGDDRRAAEATEQAPSGKDLLTRFEAAMKDVYVRAKREAGYPANHYLGMLAQYGGLETARRLLASDHVSDGFVALWERKRLDLTVENVILREEFEPLFSEEDRETARRRLAEYGFHGSSG